MILLAQASPWDAPMTIGAWLGCLLFVVMLVNACGKLYDRFSGKGRERTLSPTPIRTQTVDQFVTVPVFDAHVLTTEQKFKIQADKREEDLRLAAQGRRLMHTEIQAVGKEVAALTVTTEQQTKQLERLDDKMDANRRELNDKLDKQLPETIATIINAKKV